MGISDLVRKVENFINEEGVQRSRRAGWNPMVQTYRGYGTEERVHVIGRVLMDNPKTPNNQVQRGYRQFFTIQVGDVPVTVNVDGQEVQTLTNNNGYFDVLIEDHGLKPGWQEVSVTTPGAEAVTAEVLVTPKGQKLGLISDIDDTIMVTNLPRAMHAVYNSWFLRTNNRQPIEGMDRFYNELIHDEPDAPVFYLSTGAWNTYDTLVKFIEEHNLPKGPLLLTDWGPTPTGMFRSGMEHKKVQLRNLLIDYPDTEWILVGDNGQHDPLIYGNLVAEHPNAVRGVAIRELTPAEHVLSHGTATSLTGPARTDREGVPAISAKDGDALLAKYLRKPF